MTPQDGGTTAGFSTVSRPAAAGEGIRVSVPMLTVVAHPDIDRVGERALLSGLVAGHPVELSRGQPFFGSGRDGRALPLGDRFVSRTPIVLRPDDASDGLWIDRHASRAVVSVDDVALGDGGRHLTEAELSHGVVIELAHRVALLLQHGPPPASPPFSEFGLVGESAGIDRVRAAIARVAPLDVPVLVLGASGTGKELVARALHAHGSRADGPFVAVNMGALTPSLAAAELFGARRGAFTGASRDRRGLFVRADGGTLFLDEIGEASAEVQVLLLRVLEQSEIVPVGDTRPRRIDVRVIAATDADLDALMVDGRFRVPLLHRLAGYPITVPPLCQRRDDVARLLIHFLRLERRRLGTTWPPSRADARQPWLPSALVTRLLRASWPGNVRELHNLARRLVIDAGEGKLDPSAADGMESIAAIAMERGGTDPASNAPVASVPSERDAGAGSTTPGRALRRRKPSEVDEDELVEALRAHRFNLSSAAVALGISRTSIYALIERSERVRFAGDVPPAEIEAAWASHQGDVAKMVAALEVSERGLRQRLKDLGLRLNA